MLQDKEAIVDVKPLVLKQLNEYAKAYTTVVKRELEALQRDMENVVHVLSNME